MSDDALWVGLKGESKAQMKGGGELSKCGGK